MALIQTPQRSESATLQGNLSAISMAAMLNVRQHISQAVEQRGAAHSFSHMMYSLTDVCCVEMVQKLNVPYVEVSGMVFAHAHTQVCMLVPHMLVTAAKVSSTALWVQDLL